jgi:hypothetical protein
MPKKYYFDNQLENLQFIYLCGFLWGDGYFYSSADLSVISCEIKYEDYLSMEPIFMEFGEWGKLIRERQFNKSGEYRKYGRFTSHNRKFLSYMYELGFNNRGDSHDQFLKNIKPEIHYAFWLGLLDADGCISDSSESSYFVDYCSSFDQNWNSLESFLTKYDINYRISKRQGTIGKYSSLNIGGRDNSLKLLNILYSNPDIKSMDRKRSRYLFTKERIKKMTE